MEIPGINDLNRAEAGEEAQMARTGGKSCCVYFSESKCELPLMRFKICTACPRAGKFVNTNPIKSIFNRVRSLAIMFLNNLGTNPLNK